MATGTSGTLSSVGGYNQSFSGETHLAAEHDFAVPKAGRMDKPLLYTTLCLLLFGLMVVYSASAHQSQADSGNSLAIFLKQAMAAFMGIAVMLGVSRIDFRMWSRFAVITGFIAIGLLLWTKFFGVTANGSERWISLPFGLQFQSSDFAKVAAVFLVAQGTCQSRLLNPTLMFNLFMISVMILLIFQQPNLSVSLIMGMLVLSMTFVRGLSWFFIGPFVPVSCYIVYQKIMHTPYQKQRIDGWLDPWKDALDTGYNLIQSYYAIGSGGLLGVGYGGSIQKLYYLPFQHTDFIFAVICEELGFIGAMLVLSLFTLFAWRGFSIALQCSNRFGQMLAFGFTFVILMQAAINIAVTVGVFPVTGVTLPFISYGGTSMVITLAMVGVLLNVSRYRQNVRSVDAV